MIKHHTELLNYLISKHGLKSYLEIGVQNPANNLNKINCPSKVGVDPEVDAYGRYLCTEVWKMTSDDYFKQSLNDKFDLIFIDGLHTAEQVEKDFKNALHCLTDKGFIVIHDCLPVEEKTTCVPRGEQKIWHGDVYKFCMNIGIYKGIEYVTYNFDNGCMVVTKNSNAPVKPFIKWGTSWDWYLAARNEAMNIKDAVSV